MKRFISFFLFATVIILAMVISNIAGAQEMPGLTRSGQTTQVHPVCHGKSNVRMMRRSLRAARFYRPVNGFRWQRMMRARRYSW